MAKRCNVIVSIFLIILDTCATNYGCVNENPCVCEIDEHNKIDLTQLSKNQGTEGFLEDEDDQHNRFYFFGCQDGDFHPEKHNLTSKTTYKGSLIYVNNANVSKTVINATSSANIKFAPAPDDKYSYQLVYSKEGNVTASIRLVCVTHYQESFIKIVTLQGTPSLVLSSPNACIINHPSGLSTGSVLLIIFFISFGVYFIGGCAVMYFIRGARGLEMIPNIDFWRSLPGLVKDGMIFLFSGCNASVITTSETYDRI